MGEKNHSEIIVQPLTPVIGAEIKNMDLGGNSSGTNFELIKEVLHRYQVVFFRNQDITVEAQKDLGELFGELVAHPNDPGLDGHPEVMIIHADESSKRIAGERWHSDVSCTDEPPMGSILRMFQVPRYGGDTLFSSMYAAYDGLSELMREFLSGLRAVHDGAPYYTSVNRKIGRKDAGEGYPKAEHPVVRTHPETGKRGIFVNEIFTTHIVGLEKSESDLVLRFLFEHLKKPEFQCRFRWEKDSIAFWDNRCTQHLAMWDYWPEVRSGYRVTVKGDRPF